MNGSDSISDPVAHRISYAESYPSARGLAPFCSAHLSLARGWWRGRWSHCADVAADWALTWHATVHDDVTITSGWRHSWHVYCTWGHHLYPGQSHGSGQLVFGSGQPIRAKKTRGASFRRPISTLFSSVASSLPPLHGGMVKTQVWQLSFLSKNQTPL
jgi:hypothetical protein